MNEMSGRRASAASLEMLRRLISFPTVSRDSNFDLIGFATAHLEGLGAETRLTYDETGQKANLYARLGPADKPGIMVSGHTDVVPVDGQDWDGDPFQACVAGERIYGRGTADMKSFIAVALALAPDFVSRGLTAPLHFALSYDEEVGCLGVRNLIADLPEIPVLPAACIVGEPTEMRIATAHKGKQSFTAHVDGLECHSSLSHTGVNAVEFAAEIVAHIRAMARRHRTLGPFDDRFEPPYTTIHTGTIAGGTALNIVPKDCRFEFEWRYLPSQDPDELKAEVEAKVAEMLPEMHAVSDATGIRIAPRSDIPALATDDEDPVTQLAKALTGANATEQVSFATEGGLFQQAGIPTIICGPGSIAEAHKPNEFIALDQIAACEDFFYRLRDRLCATPE